MGTHRIKVRHLDNNFKLPLKMMEMPTASDVGAVKIYKSLSELGLTEATATAEAIASAMLPYSILFHPCGATATTAELAFPFNYGFFSVQKLNSSGYVDFEYVIGGRHYYGYYNHGNTNNRWSGWSTQFLPLDGSMSMSGALKLNKDYFGYLNSYGTTGEKGVSNIVLRAFKTAGMENHSRVFMIWPNNTIDNSLIFRDYDNGTVTGDYKIYGEHNKELLSGTETDIALIDSLEVHYEHGCSCWVDADNTVHLRINAVVKDGGYLTANGDMTIGTIPVGFRPRRRINGMINLQNTSSMNVAILWADQYGTVALGAMPNSSFVFLHGELTYKLGN